MSEMNKAEIVAELEAMAWHRLFNSRQWLADRETAYAVKLKLTKMGLIECISSNVWRFTPSGKELNVKLFWAFMGIWDVWEVLGVLEEYRFIDEWEFDSLYTRMYRRTNPESILVGYLRRAYLDRGKANNFFTLEPCLQSELKPTSLP
jgi:hypothetical protein